jgi:undecaprenyl pyrophosphate phosphatase UppP
VRRHGFAAFAIYRIVIGIVLLIWGARIMAY